MLWPVQQSGAAVKHNDIIVTLGLLSKQHVTHTPISHVSLVLWSSVLGCWFFFLAWILVQVIILVQLNILIAQDSFLPVQTSKSIMKSRNSFTCSVRSLRGNKKNTWTLGNQITDFTQNMNNRLRIFPITTFKWRQLEVGVLVAWIIEGESKWDHN